MLFRWFDWQRKTEGSSAEHGNWERVKSDIEDLKAQYKTLRRNVENFPKPAGPDATDYLHNLLSRVGMLEESTKEESENVDKRFGKYWQEVSRMDQMLQSAHTALRSLNARVTALEGGKSTKPAKKAPVKKAKRKVRAK